MSDMKQANDESQPLILTMEVSEPAIVGLSVLATLRLTNNGKSPVTVPSRLNLMEGALALEITGPDQKPRTINGWQADTQLREVTLESKEQFISHLNLFETEEGPVFPEAGSYKLRARFSPSPRLTEIVSNEISVTVRSPKSKSEIGAAKLLENPELRKSIVLGQSDETPNELRKLADDYAETLDGKLAALILTGAKDEPETSEIADSSTTAASAVPMICALRTPYSGVGKRLAADLSAKLDAGDSTKQTENLKRILTGKPIKA